MGIKRTVQENPVYWVLSMLVASFIAGLGAYQGILKIANLTVVSRSETRDALRNRLSELQVAITTKDAENANLTNRLHDLESETSKLRAEQSTMKELSILVVKLQDDLKLLKTENQNLRRRLEKYSSSFKPKEKGKSNTDIHTVLQKTSTRQNFFGYVDYADDTSVEFHWLWCSLAGTDIPYSNNLLSFEGSSLDLKKFSIASVAEIEFHDFAEQENQIIEDNKIKRTVRKATITFSDNTVYNNIYLDAFGCRWEGLRERGNVEGKTVRRLRICGKFVPE